MIINLPNKAYLSNITVTNIFHRFSYEMAAKNGWNKFTNMKQIYFTVSLCVDDTDGGQQLLRSTFSRDRVIRACMRQWRRDATTQPKCSLDVHLTVDWPDRVVGPPEYITKRCKCRSAWLHVYRLAVKVGVKTQFTLLYLPRSSNKAYMYTMRLTTVREGALSECTSNCPV